MLTKALRKIDKFYAVLAGVLLLLAATLIYTGLGIFSAINTAHEIDTTVQAEAMINRQLLVKTVEEVYSKGVPDLLIKETTISQIPTD